MDGDDYDRACECSKLVETIDVGDAHALVLGDEPAMTCAAPLPDGIALVRWYAADDVAQVDRAIVALSKTGARGRITGLELGLEGPVVLFDSVEPGAEQTCFAIPEGDTMADGALRVDLVPGRYRVELGELDPAVGALSLILLRR